MSQRADALADAFAACHAEVVQAVTSLSPQQWPTLTAAEQWPAGFAFYHVAQGYELIGGWVEAGAAGPRPAVLDPAANDAANALSLAAHRDCGKDEVLALLDDRGRRLIELLRGLSDEQLARGAVMLPNGTTRSVEQVASGPLLGHTRNHLASIASATGLA